MSFIRGLLAATLAFAAWPLQAATVTQCGPNVCYEYDNAQAAVGLTGLPTLVGDTMQFLPPSFAAQSTGGAGWVTVGGAAGNFIFSRVYTTNVLNEIVSLTVHEEFDYEIITGGEVRASLYTQARSLVLPSDGTSTVVNFIDTGDTGGPLIDTLTAVLYPAAAFSAIANNMQVGIQNTLRAYTGAAGEDAFIQKKFTLVTETLTPVPVPAAAWLLAGGLGALGWLRRKAGTGRT
jgi:hypothetical protein